MPKRLKRTQCGKKKNLLLFEKKFVKSSYNLQEVDFTEFLFILPKGVKFRNFHTVEN